jgi:phosphoglycerate dehydrogenase-like enzyme
VSADKAVRAGHWGRKFEDLIGFEVMGKTIGIVGLGKIGTEVAKRLKAFKVNLLYFSRKRKKKLEVQLGMKSVGLKNLLKRSEIITLHLPHTPDTHHLFSRKEFASMREGVFIVNTARGKIIDQEALIEALKQGRAAGAALDVFDFEPLDVGSPLTKMDNVILTPHIGASSVEAMRRMAVQLADGVLNVLSGKPYHDVVVK